MGRSKPALLIFVLALAPLVCFSQSRVTVSDPRIEMEGNTIHIYYDILNAGQGERFNITLEVTSEEGEAIRANALSGDVGSGVEGGSEKHVAWDLGADGIRLNARVFFEIHAVLEVTPAPVAPVQKQVEEPGEEVMEDSRRQEGSRRQRREQEEADLVKEKGWTRTGLMLQSLAVPGLGLTRLTGRPHWLRAVAGFGCIAGAINSNNQAINTYNSIETTAGFDQKVELYQTAIGQDNLSEVFAWTAFGIWVTDIIWTYFRTSDVPWTKSSSGGANISVGSGMDPLTLTPTFGIRYTFKIKP